MRSQNECGGEPAVCPYPEFIDRLRGSRRGKFIGRQLTYLAQTDSTNLQVRRRALEGAEEGLVLLADCQSAGKGRMGREWQSPEGVNLYFSILLRPPLPPASAAQIPLLAGIAAARGISRATGLEGRIKWPNDVLLGGKKIAGILAEMEAEGGQIRFVILGIGVNVNWRRRDMPAFLRETATSLMEEGGDEFSRFRVADEIFEEFEREYTLFLREGFSAGVREEWNRLSWVNQKHVIASAVDKTWEGLALGLDEDGALLLEDEEGRIHRFIAGDVSLRL
jgi:BirA family transcriptional regulator, biotin operon repressor / biotin---[acetyl-CoA-carboxylase] ligase